MLLYKLLEEREEPISPFPLLYLFSSASLLRCMSSLWGLVSSLRRLRSLIPTVPSPLPLGVREALFLLHCLLLLLLLGTHRCRRGLLWE